MFFGSALCHLIEQCLSCGPCFSVERSMHSCSACYPKRCTDRLSVVCYARGFKSPSPSSSYKSLSSDANASRGDNVSTAKPQTRPCTQSSFGDPLLYTTIRLTCILTVLIIPWQRAACSRALNSYGDSSSIAYITSVIHNHK
jgi:hypothetical protein